MKGGKDMRKIYTMYNENEQYIIKINEQDYLEIKKRTLNVDGKKLYEMMFSNFKKGDKIDIKMDRSFNSDNKLDIAVYENVKEIIEKIADRINENEEIR